MCEETLKHKNYQNESQKEIPQEKHTVHWFRKGLRLHDNPSLRAGIKGATTLRCIFIIDPWFAGSSNVGINKWRFLLQCLEDLDRGLRKLNSRLFVIRGQPADALPKLFKEWNITCLTFEEDPEPFGKVRDENVSQMCKELGIEVISAVSHTLYNLDTIIEKNNGQAPLTYHKFQAVIASINPPVQSESAITQETLNNTYTPIMDDHDDKYNVPTLDELGFDTDGLKPPVWIGGETEALARLERHLERKAWVASFGRPKMTPQSLLATQTGLSPYLRFGCLSTRLFYHHLTDLYKKIKKSMPPLSLHGQLLWREFFYCAATKNPNFDKMEDNEICVQIPWDKNAEALAKWSNGQTGFPWIDAIMTQLREEGWIHHLARHAVACFLTRGDLWISWEEGMKVFEELLLDADWSNNAGMWMWLSCSSFFQQFFHCYCPVRFGRKADPNGDYIRRFLPILKNFPTKYIHEPWNAPESVQRSAKCVIGKDYPVPMVNHAVVSRANMERMKQVYLHLTKYRVPVEEKENTHKGLSSSIAIVSNTQSLIPYAVSSPSPTTVIVNTNNSGNYLCQQARHNNRATSTIISTDLNHHQQNSEQYYQLHQQNQQQVHHQQVQNQHDNHNQHHHLYQHNNQDYQSLEQHHQQQQYIKNMPATATATITVHDYVKLQQQQRQAINDSDCLSINIYDNIRELQQNYQIDFDSNINQQQHQNHQQQNNNYDNINNKYSRNNQQLYNKKINNDKDYYNNNNNRYKSTTTDMTSSSDNLNNYHNNSYINNSVIMQYDYNNDYSRYVDDHLLTDQYKNEFNVSNHYDACDGVGPGNGEGNENVNVQNLNNKTVIQNDTNFNNNNSENNDQHQYQNLDQQQIENNDNNEQNILKLNFKCELEENDK